MTRRPRRNSTPSFKAKVALVAIKGDQTLTQLVERFDGEIAPLYSDEGQTGIATRFVIGVLLLKHIYGCPTRACASTGSMIRISSTSPGKSSLRKRLGDRLELLLAESLRVAQASGALCTTDLARVAVDTTVRPKSITFSTDAKLLHASIKGLNRPDRKHVVQLRQSYLRVAKHAAMMAGRYAHAK